MLLLLLLLLRTSHGSLSCSSHQAAVHAESLTLPLALDAKPDENNKTFYLTVPGRSSLTNTL